MGKTREHLQQTPHSVVLVGVMNLLAALRLARGFPCVLEVIATAKSAAHPPQPPLHPSQPEVRLICVTFTTHTRASRVTHSHIPQNTVSHACGIVASDNSIKCWGDNTQSKSTPPTNFVTPSCPHCPWNTFGPTCTLSCSTCETHGSVTPKCNLPTATCGCDPGWQGTPLCTIPNTGVYLTAASSTDCSATRTITHTTPGCPSYIIPSDCSTTAPSTITVSGAGFTSAATVTVGGGACCKRVQICAWNVHTDTIFMFCTAPWMCKLAPPWYFNVTAPPKCTKYRLTTAKCRRIPPRI